MTPAEFRSEHFDLTRRFFLRAGISSIAATQISLAVADASSQSSPKKHVKPDKGGVRTDPYFTPTEDFRDVSRGKPLPHALPDDKKLEVGLTRESWRLEVIADPDHPQKSARR